MKIYYEDEICNIFGCTPEELNEQYAANIAIELLGIADKISHYSGLSLTRVYLEEDCDANLLFDTAKEKGYEVITKSGYNLNFNIHHNYKPELFAWEPKFGAKIIFSKIEYTITGILPTKLMIQNNNGNVYRIPLSNPFNFIDSIIN